MSLSIRVELYCCLEDGWGRLYLLTSNVVYYCRIVTLPPPMASGQLLCN